MHLMEYFDLLPEDITVDILSRLPIESVLECKLVCTAWRGLVRRSTFSKMHLHHSGADSGKLGFIAFTEVFAKSREEKLQYFEYNDENHGSIERIRRINFNLPLESDTRFLGSCNGLICYLRENTYTVCNPITREYIMFPEFKRVRMGHGAYGFGYVDSTNEYKVVRIMYEYGTQFMEVYVYTLGSGNGWRNIGKFNFGTIEYWGGGLYFNGSLYWMDVLLRMFVTLDLSDEKFCELLSPPPHLSNSDFDGNYRLGVLDGCLYFGIHLFDNGYSCWDVWLLKKKDDNHGTKELKGHQSFRWTRVFTSYDFIFRYLFAVTKSHSALTYRENQINIHNLDVSISEKIAVFEGEDIGAIFPHKNTFVSLKELGEEDTKMMD